ncbi:hypothetical protein TTHERM_000310179 (macronuclear) [Tetrahymena thermophila SB210]|uniref:Uncharacterized protein n=1 Tax=Tetrahymena thermophila (strain SB210) TaxID=312017 RepID=W7XIB3_TETTS|nr:hypothetical protein TTHERM_000310179 [Tetrahymena thermophila SB210]EWS73149.1 hypothetical protein TTHERM_000310179 [Tetrahymena thermophila SB210]|eukprot:XP_012654336.1 hypothetical protein TTHERM_000310179 [Tetrahymena thermophila SB210]
MKVKNLEISNQFNHFLLLIKTNKKTNQRLKIKINHNYITALIMQSSIYVQEDLKLAMNMTMLFQIYQIKFQSLVSNINYLNMKETTQRDNYPISQKQTLLFLLCVTISKTYSQSLQSSKQNLQIMIGKDLKNQCRLFKNLLKQFINQTSIFQNLLDQRMLMILKKFSEIHCNLFLN